LLLLPWLLLLLLRELLLLWPLLSPESLLAPPLLLLLPELLLLVPALLFTAPEGACAGGPCWRDLGFSMFRMNVSDARWFSRSLFRAAPA
jgi:hypothetical protein